MIKTYAYLVHLANITSHPNIIESRTRQGRIGSDNQSFNYQSQYGTSYYNQQGSGDSSGLGTSGQNYTTETQEWTYGYKEEIKLEGILGSGQTGRTFKAIICG